MKNATIRTSHILLITLLSIFFSACESNKHDEKGQAQTSRNEPNRVMTEANNGTQPETSDEYFDAYDVIDIDSIWLDGKAEAYGQFKNILKVFGSSYKKSVDSEYCVAFFNNDAPQLTLITYESAQFEVYRDSAALLSMDFERTDKKLLLPQIALSSNTKMEEIKSVFPKSYEHRYPIQVGNSGEQIVIPILPCNFCDDQILLIFLDNKLTEFIYHMDC